jgi:tRNA nucleotidyltransferase (CCA-adding enzyme)
MVGKRPEGPITPHSLAAQDEISTDGLGERIAALPGFAAARAAAEQAHVDAYLVGGAVRDALLGRPVTNLDLVVDGDQMPLIEALGAEAIVHDRFETATVELPSGPVDVARARTESYSEPGALPEVRPAELADDLVRRDFTVNALAVPLADPATLIDAHGGLDDLSSGLLRVFHERSFVDDPTRALRAARYAARLGLEPEPRTLELLRDTDLTTVSGDRVAAELGKLAAGPEARRGFELLAEWGLASLPPQGGELIERVTELLTEPPWAGVVGRPAIVLAAARGPDARSRELAALDPPTPSAAVEAAHGSTGVELLLARALGAAWLDRYVGEWSRVALEISGEDLISAGVHEGPAVGRGLAAALRAKLDGEAPRREDELRIAMDEARRP